MEMFEILKRAVERGASDIHIVVGKSPMVRAQGRVVPLEEFRQSDGRIRMHRQFTRPLQSIGLSNAGDFRNPDKSAELMREKEARKNYRIDIAGTLLYLKVHKEKPLSKSGSAGRRATPNPRPPARTDGGRAG